MWSYPLAWLFFDRRLTFTIAYTSLIIHLYYLLLSSILLYLLRHNYILRKQNLYLAVLSSVFNGLAAVSLYVDLLMGEDAPRYVRLWASSCVYPMCLVLYVHARILHFWLKDSWNRVHFNDKRTILLKEAVDNASILRKLWAILDSPYHRKRYGVLALVLTTLIYHIFTTLIVQFATNYNCAEMFNMSYVFIGASITVYSVSCPWLLFKLQNINDAYKMRNDLRWAIATGVPLLAFLLLNWVHHPWAREVNQLFPPLLIALVSLLCIHSFIVVLPILRAMVWMLRKHKYVHSSTSPEENNLITPVLYYNHSRRRVTRNSFPPREPLVKPRQAPKFEDALANPHFYEKFRRHIMREFNSHYLLFQTETRDFTRAYLFHGETTHEMHEHAIHLYEKYISQGGMCQLGEVRLETKVELERNLEAGVYDTKLFERARVEVYNLMKRDSYPRFIQGLTPLELEHFVLHCGTLHKQTSSTDGST